MTFAQTHADLTSRRATTKAYDGVLVDEIVALGEDVLDADPSEIQLAAALTHHWETSEFSNDPTDLLDSADGILDEVAKIVEVEQS